MTMQGVADQTRTNARALATANIDSQREANQRDTNAMILNNNSFMSNVRDIVAREDASLQHVNKTELLNHPVKTFLGGLSNAWIDIKTASGNVETILGGLFGYGVYTTPTFGNETSEKPIPIYAMGEVFKQRNIAEKGMEMQNTFATNLNKSSSDFNVKYGSLINQTSNEFMGNASQFKDYQTDFAKLNQTYTGGISNLKSLGLGSVNSTGQFNFNMPSPVIVNVYKEGTTSQKIFATADIIAGKTAEAIVGGELFTAIGGTQFVSNLGKATIDLGGDFGGTAGSLIAKGGVYTAGVALALTPIAINSYSMSKQFSSGGSSGTTGALIGGAVGLGETSGFMTGATGGEFLFVPGLKLRDVGMPDAFGKAPTKILSLENPFGSQSISLISKSQEGFSFGNPKLNAKTFGLSSDLGIEEYSYQASSKTEVNLVGKTVSFGNERLATEQIIFEQGMDLVQGLKGVKINDISQIPFEKSGVWENLGENQLAKDIIKTNFKDLGLSQKGWKGFWNTITNRGLERLYGSSTISSEGGFKTSFERTGEKFGDFDLNFRDNAIPKAEKLFAELKGTGADVKLTSSLIELKNPMTGSYEHAFDFHGADTPDLMMKDLKLGIKGVGTKQFGIESGFIKGQQLRQSLVDKGSATLQLRINKDNKFYFSPPDYRMKDVSDFVSIAERLNLVKGGDMFGTKISSFKNVLKVAYPDINFGGESKLMFSSGDSNYKTNFNLFGIKDYGTSKTSMTSLGKFNSGISMANFNSRGSSNSYGSLLPSSYSISPSSFSLGSISPYSPSPSPSKSKSPSIYSKSSYSPSMSPSDFNLSPMPFSGFNIDKSLGGWAIGSPRKKGRKSPWDLSPGFVDIVFDIKSFKPIKVSKTYGVSPWTTRGLYGTGKKRKKKAYYEMTDL
jgi:hypothetical protein